MTVLGQEAVHVLIAAAAAPARRALAQAVNDLASIFFLFFSPNICLLFFYYLYYFIKFSILLCYHCTLFFIFSKSPLSNRKRHIGDRVSSLYGSAIFLTF